jgi:hypothetical protein
MCSRMVVQTRTDLGVDVSIRPRGISLTDKAAALQKSPPTYTDRLKQLRRALDSTARETSDDEGFTFGVSAEHPRRNKIHSTPGLE